MNFHICLIKVLIKLKTKKIKKLLQFDLENTLVDMGTEYGQQQNRIKRSFYKKNIVVCF